METRKLGPDGPDVTRLGLGLAALGRPAYITLGHGEDFEDRSVEAMERRAHRMLDAAWAAGIRYFDAARSYGRAEAFLRSWLDRAPRPDAVIGSKWGYRYTGDWRLQAERHEVKDHGLAAFRTQSAESLALLGGRLALYQIHSATPESGVLEDPEVLDALAGLREQGIRIGVSASGPTQARTIRRALEIERDGRPLFASVQATWNLLEPSAGEALREAHAAGRTVLIKEVLANGRLTSRGAEGQTGPLATTAAGRGVTPDAVAIAAALAQPWADVVLLGAATEAQLGSNLRALSVGLEEASFAALSTLREEAGRYWSDRSALPWT